MVRAGTSESGCFELAGAPPSSWRSVDILRPKIAIQGAVLDGFADMVGLDVFGTGEVGDGSRDFQNPVIRPGAEVELGHGHLHHALGGFVEVAVALELLVGHARVAA